LVDDADEAVFHGQVDFRTFFDGVGERAVGFHCEVVATGRGGRWLVVGEPKGVWVPGGCSWSMEK